MLKIKLLAYLILKNLPHITRYSAFDVSAFFRKRSYIWRNETYWKEYGMHCFQRRWIWLNLCYRIQTTEVHVFDWSIHEQFQSLIKQPGIIVDKTHLFWEISTKTLWTIKLQFWISCQGKGLDSILKTLQLNFIRSRVRKRFYRHTCTSVNSSDKL